MKVMENRMFSIHYYSRKANVNFSTELQDNDTFFCHAFLKVTPQGTMLACFKNI